ncbi:MAG: serine/threonine protein phosphatase [Melioribacteraceae bacterium]|nr:MAG: serine/threonine protein phosphatase [Melioribacteraceae bacterium]
MIGVIGDIHGCYYTLIELYNKIVKKYDEIEIYAVGDLVDRGNHSADVIDFIIDERIKFTAGNHDLMFSHFFTNPHTLFARSWSLNGNETTLKSYEGRESDIREHLELINEAALFIDTPDAFISHAGISEKYAKMVSDEFEYILDRIEVLVEEDYMTDRGVLWTRDKLLNLGKLQIVGHTKQEEVTFDANSNVLYIDTGACVGNKLSCVVVNDGELIETISESTHLNDII